MRRAAMVIASTAGGLVLVANFHTNPSGAPLATRSGPALSTSTSAPDSTTPASTAPPAASAPSGTSATSSPPSTAASAPRTVTGPAVTTDYGNVQVRITLNGTRIVDAQALQLPNDRSRSVRISQYAGPQLRAEALQAQSAHIQLVSGASFTSQGYIESLQGALDLARR
jgi:uncharacterized protein with FMN-binding domain